MRIREGDLLTNISLTGTMELRASVPALSIEEGGREVIDSAGLNDVFDDVTKHINECSFASAAYDITVTFANTSIPTYTDSGDPTIQPLIRTDFTASTVRISDEWPANRVAEYIAQTQQEIKTFCYEAAEQLENSLVAHTEVIAVHECNIKYTPLTASA